MNVSMPDLTLAQLTAAATWLVTQIVAWGWIDNQTGQWVLSLVGTLLPGFWMIGDAILRHGRATGVGPALIEKGTTIQHKKI